MLTGFRWARSPRPTYVIDTSVNPIRFEIDGKVSAPANPPRTLKLGKTEEWTIRGAPVPHPLHIHMAFDISLTHGIVRLKPDLLNRQAKA